MTVTCTDIHRLFFEPGEVTEIRAYGLSGKNRAWEGYARGAGIVYGYFDDPEAFGKAAEALDQAKAPGIYFVLNPVIPDLLARAANRLRAADQKTVTTSDKDILALRWLFIDLDPKRPTAISSSNEELTAAVKLRNKIHRWFRDEHGHSDCIPAVSGNGAHLLVRLPDIPLTMRDEPSNDPGVRLIRASLRALASRFNTPEVDVDVSTYNPARLCKLYGTVVRKGDHIPSRPHRKSYIENAFWDQKQFSQAVDA